MNHQALTDINVECSCVAYKSSLCEGKNEAFEGHRPFTASSLETKRLEAAWRLSFAEKVNLNRDKKCPRVLAIFDCIGSFDKLMTSSHPPALHQEDCLALADCSQGVSLPSCVVCMRFGFLPANISFPLFSLFPSASRSLCSPWNLFLCTRCSAVALRSCYLMSQS